MIVLPVLVPLLSGLLALLAWNQPRVQRSLGLLGAAAQVGAAIWLLITVQQQGIQHLMVGNWPAPFGIALVADLFSALMVMLAAIVALTIAIYSQAGMDERRVRLGFYPLFFFLLMGVNGAFITGDLFNLYVWFEVMLMSSFVLIALGGERSQVEGAIKYVVLNLLSSTLFLSAVGLTYNLAGTLNMADLAIRLPASQASSQVSLIAMLFLVAFGIKSAIFPLFFWLPASYHTPPVAITALFSGLLTKVGVYALIRVFTLLFVRDVAYTHSIILIIAGFTMVSGVFGAAAQTDFRRLLSFHIISQIGYLLMGLGLFTQGALAASLYFMVHVILAKTALFLVAGIVDRMEGSFNLKVLGGIYARRFWVALLFLLPALSLAGLPPLSGFFAKLALVITGLEAQQYPIVAVALAVSFMTLYSMTKVWNEVFWKDAKPSEAPKQPNTVSAWLWVPTLAVVLLSVAAGLLAEPLLNLAAQAASQLMDPGVYVQAVLGGVP
ncbi:MAG: Na+/H+ antiporter subunit D [Anaerolineales bacterium]|jgi:multicomponent Na+:H+ antiporter subunit D|nr:Na+/H+ antiporter subunit D [Anaerolineales bacterium]